MKRIYAVAILLGGALISRSAAAADQYLCCDLTVKDGACVGQSSPCPQSSAWWVTLSDLSASAAAGWPLVAGDINASFPSGTDGYASWTPQGPWVGFCLDAPAPQDPTHAGPTDPIGCISLSLAPGVGAQSAEFGFPVDPRWDGYQLCYGPPNGPSDSGVACQNPNDVSDLTVSLTPSGSCCGSAHVLAESDYGAGAGEWQTVVNQEIPGVPPPVIVYGPDGGIVSYYAPPIITTGPDGGLEYMPAAYDTLGALPDACVPAYNEPTACGQPPPAGGPRPGELGASSGSVDAAAESGAGAGAGDAGNSGGCSVNATTSGRGGAGAFALAFGLLGLVLTRRRSARANPR
ncbi:MAG TPA: hypothetical protein VK762_02565 [Polyangiaceae bacterium]|nr:hypothetical protein [Polyangiaceae bacterium]